MSQVLVDTFNDTNGALLTAHTSNNGKTWAKVPSATGDAVISNNQVRTAAVATNTVHYLVTPPASANQTVTWDVFVNNTSSFLSMWARAKTDLTDAYLIQINNAQVALIKRVAGTSTQLVVRSPTLPSGELYRCKLVLSGTSIKGEMYRYSTQQYLSSGSFFQAGQAYFADIIDSSITAANTVLLSAFSATDTTSYMANISVLDDVPGSPRGHMKSFFPNNIQTFSPTASALAEFTYNIDALGYLGGNIQSVDYIPCPWVDLVNNSRGFGLNTGFSEGGVSVDANGWPTQACRNVICTNDQVSSVPIGTYKGSFEWQSTVGTMTASTTTNCSVSNIVTAGQLTTFDLVVTNPLTLIMEWTQGIKNLKIITAGYATTGYPLLRTEAVNHYKKFACLRAMDYMRINNSNETTWSSRVPAGKSFGAKSWESLFDFANACYSASGSKTKALWICVPHQSDSTYWTSLATLAMSSLPSDMVVYWEFSNECGNTLFTQELFLRNAAIAEVAAGGSTLVGGDQYNQRSKLYGRKTAQMAQAVLAVYPNGSLNTRVRPVITSLFVDATNHPVDALAQMNTYHGAVAGYLHTVSSAPYPQGSLVDMNAAANAAALIDILRNTGANAISTENTNFGAFMALAQSYGLKRCVAYEWGPHTHGSANQAVKQAAHLDADMGNIVKEIAHKAWANGWGLLNYYHVTPGTFLSNNENSLWPVAQSFGSGDIKLAALNALLTETKPTNG